MAQVFLARHRGPMGFEKLLVIKKIHSHLADEPNFINMFLDEARIAARINNQRVVQIYELGCEAGRYYMAMEYLAGESLAAVIRRGRREDRPLPLELAVRIVADTAEGLHAAHELKSFTGEPMEVVHRDVSPGNIVILYDGGVKVVDFGVVKAKGKIAQTTGGELKGKFSYMSPEQLTDGVVDRRSDVFSLGTVLWESLALRRLFRARTDGATVRALLSGDRHPPSTHRSDIPPELDAIVLRAIAQDAAERYQTSEDLRAALDEFLYARGTRTGSRQLHTYMKDLFAERILARERLIHDMATGVAPEAEDSGVMTLADGFEDSNSSSLNLPWSSGDLPDVGDSPAQVPPLPVPPPFPDGPGPAAKAESDVNADPDPDRGLKVDGADGAAPTEIVESLDDDVIIEVGDLSATERPPSAEVGIQPTRAPVLAPAPRRFLLPASAGAVAVVAALAFGVWFFLSPSDDAIEATVSAADDDEPSEQEVDRGENGTEDDRDEHAEEASTAASGGMDEDPATASTGTADVPATATAAPDDALAKDWVKKGKGHLAAGRYDAAHGAFSKALEASPRSHAALAGLSEAAFESGDLDKAAAYAKKAVKISPRSVRYRMALGKAYFASGRYDEAVRQFERVLERDPDHASAKKIIETARKRMK